MHIFDYHYLKRAVKLTGSLLLVALIYVQMAFADPYIVPLTLSNAYKKGALAITMKKSDDAYLCMQANVIVKINHCNEFFYDESGRYFFKTGFPKDINVLILFYRGFEDAYKFYLNSTEITEINKRARSLKVRAYNKFAKKL